MNKLIVGQWAWANKAGSYTHFVKFQTEGGFACHFYNALGGAIDATKHCSWKLVWGHPATDGSGDKVYQLVMTLDEHWQ